MQERGFPQDEFEIRVAHAQKDMASAGIEALLLSTEADVRYFTGFLTRFWESPTRPWFVIVPAAGDPIAVIPSIGAALMAQTWLSDIRTWRAPDPHDDGVSLLIDTLNQVAGAGRIGVPSGPETHIRMPLADWARVVAGCDGTIGSANGIMRRLRAIKSDREIAKIARACDIAAAAFADVPRIAAQGTPLSQVFREFQAACLGHGADWVPYLAGGAGPSGYSDVISPAADTPLARGDVLMLDTGLVWDGYFCDFDRNFSVGPPDTAAREAHARLIDAVDAAADIAAPGATAAELFHAMDRIVTGGAGGSDAGRLGHGLGMQLTEGLSLVPADHTPLKPGMVITLEPGMDVAAGRIMVHEEVIAITQEGCRFLSPRASRELVQI
ncbi:Xaa-Pro peptidase family protein [Sulfitobacter sp. S190]|uniref:M24 family metallopeptidase n=1 Tax=Sulfitobacter sp. S190 TaxID=2867022 RepID=UPI0021A2B9E9|nr:Xaa-Pro peptidase family protein [Sulfitobacter sp. S190]UWR21579.1 Xaa-Pro peptidase family protein [Sulfitobacter sp. S190]